MRSIQQCLHFFTPERLFLFAAILLVPLAAQAYVGPGAGLSLLSALWGLLCAIGAAFLFVIMWPIRRMRRRRREARQQKEGTQTTADQPAQTREDASSSQDSNHNV